MIEIHKANSFSHFQIIEELASTIWWEHYPSIIGNTQVTYMLEKFNSAKAIEEQVNSGSNFYYMSFDGIPIGYMAIKNETDFLFLSKLYVMKTYRGKGVGKATMAFITDEASRLNQKAIQLKVNKYNTNSIAAYEKLGYKKIKAMITDIGEGFVMDDYLLEKALI